MADVWIRECRRTAKCSHCKQQIQNHEYEVIVKIWKRGSEVKRFVTVLFFHPQCWIEQGIEAAKKRPAVENRGRHRTAMLDEVREKRIKILRRRASIVQRIRYAMDSTPPNFDKVSYLGEKLGELVDEIRPLGGVPESWGEEDRDRLVDNPPDREVYKLLDGEEVVSNVVGGTNE